MHRQKLEQPVKVKGKHLFCGLIFLPSLKSCLCSDLTFKDDSALREMWVREPFGKRTIILHIGPAMKNTERKSVSGWRNCLAKKRRREKWRQEYTNVLDKLLSNAGA